LTDHQFVCPQIDRHGVVATVSMEDDSADWNDVRCTLCTLNVVATKLDMDWIHPWIALGWIGWDDWTVTPF